MCKLFNVMIRKRHRLHTATTTSNATCRQLLQLIFKLLYQIITALQMNVFDFSIDHRFQIISFQSQGTLCESAAKTVISKK